MIYEFNHHFIMKKPAKIKIVERIEKLFENNGERRHFPGVHKKSLDTGGN